MKEKYLFKVCNFDAMLFFSTQIRFGQWLRFLTSLSTTVESCCSFANTVFYIVIQNAGVSLDKIFGYISIILSTLTPEAQ